MSSPTSTPAGERPPDALPDVRRFRVTACAIGLVAGVLSALLGIGGGMPTRVNVPAKRVPEAVRLIREALGKR